MSALFSVFSLRSLWIVTKAIPTSRSTRTSIDASSKGHQGAEWKFHAIAKRAVMALVCSVRMQYRAFHS